MAECKIDITKAVKKIIEELCTEGKLGKWEQGKCTNCEKRLEDLFEGDFYYDCEELHFCPNCGAKMIKNGDTD